MPAHAPHLAQVAKPLLDAAGKAGATRAPPPPAVKQLDLCAACVGKLLAWREQMLVAGLAADVGAAAARGGAQAAAAAFDDSLDRVVRSGAALWRAAGCGPSPPCAPGLHRRDRLQPASRPIHLHRPACRPVSCPQTTLGWAWTDRYSFDAFAREAASAPAALREPLSLLCLLYGLCRLEAGVECYLSAGVRR